MADEIDHEDAADGRQAFTRGWSTRACPYRGGRRREVWLRGWYGAQSALEAKPDVTQPMKKYFMHLYEGDSVVLDELGAEYESLDAAVEDAEHGAIDIMSEQTSAERRARTQKIEICDTSGTVLRTLWFRDPFGPPPDAAA